MHVWVVLAIATWFASAESSDALWRAEVQAALQDDNAGRYAQAETKFRALLESTPESDARFSELLLNLARTREQQGDLVEAERLCRRSLQIRENNLPPNDLSIAEAGASLGSVLLVSGRQQEAYEFLRRAVAMYQDGNDDVRTAQALGELGLTLMAMNEPARAQPVLRRSWALYGKTRGADSIEAARVENSIAALENTLHEYKKAEKDLRQVLPVFEREFGRDSPVVAAILDNLFAAIFAQRRLNDAEPFLGRAVAIMDHVARETPQLLRIRANQASFEAEARNFRESARIFEEVIEAEQRLRGAKSPEVARELTDYSRVLKQMHRNTEARQAESRASAILRSFR